MKQMIEVSNKLGSDETQILVFGPPKVFYRYFFLSLLDSISQILCLVSKAGCTREGKGISICLVFQEKVVLCLSYLI